MILRGNFTFSNSIIAHIHPSVKGFTKKYSLKRHFFVFFYFQRAHGRGLFQKGAPFERVFPPSYPQKELLFCALFYFTYKCVIFPVFFARALQFPR